MIPDALTTNEQFLHDLLFDGYQHEGDFVSDESMLRDALRDSWRKKHGVDIEESLNISGHDVSTMARLLHRRLVDLYWEVSDGS